MLSAQIAHPQEGDFVEGGLVMSCEASLCFSAGQHRTMCSADMALQCFWTGQVGTQEFNSVENGEVSNVLVFDRNMKCFLT